ncbi:MAG: ATP-binding protein [Thermoanaerobaculia bacterium]|nr:ATP-binding protein [Thermoanaerobaculia bacterium]
MIRTPLARQLQWLVAIRLVVITSVVLPYFLLQISPPDQVAFDAEPAITAPAPGSALILERRLETRLLYLIAGLTYLANLAYIALMRLLRGRHRLQAYIQFFGDLLLVTLLVYFFGGLESPFSVLYLVVIAVATTLLRKRATGVATVAFALYAVLLLALYEGWIAMPDGSFVAQDLGALSRLIYNLSVHLFAFYSVTFLTWFLVANVARAERELVAKAEEMTELELKYRDVVQSISSGLITTDRSGTVTSLNRAGREILRRPETEVVGLHVTETGLISRQQWEGFRRSDGGTGRLESEVQVLQEEDPIYVGFSITELESAEGDRIGSIVIFQDLTPWRQLEEEVRRKDRMAAVGTLAAGLAHEIGNPLAAISGSVQMLARSIHDGAPEHRLLGILLKESQRLDRTIKNFLSYARPGEPSAVECDVAELLAENFELLANSPEVGSEHRLDLRVDPPSARVVADPDGISQIFWNLARNALKAMPEGGTLRVEGRLGREGYEGYEIEFFDTGKGMTEEERANLFHPFKSFFDQGSGLGMAIVYRIVQDHGGDLSVDSRPGGHTRITVRLPRQPAGRLQTESAETGEEAWPAEPAGEHSEVPERTGGTQ